MFQDNFVDLSATTMIDPALKIVLRMGRLNLEMNGVQEVDVFHDPEICVDRLMMLESESPYVAGSSNPLLAGASDVLIPFVSRARTALMGFGFSRTLTSDRVIWSNRRDAYGLQLQKKSVEAMCIPGISDDPLQLIAYLLSKFISLRDWDQSVPADKKARIGRIELHMEKSFCDGITKVTGQAYTTASNQTVVLGSREINR